MDILSGREWKSIVEYFNLDITITTGHFASPERASSRGKDYPVVAKGM